MYKNQLQELAQRSCFNLPSYACMREGPDHAPKFKATVNFNGEIFESPGYCSTLRQAEHAAAEVALNTLSRRGPVQSLAARILDETGVCKNLLQETAQRAGVSLPNYSTARSGPGHLPIFTCTIEIAGLQFIGEAAKTKKQAEKNAAMSAWSALKKYANKGSQSRSFGELEVMDEQDQSVIVRALAHATGRENDYAHQHPHVHSLPILHAGGPMSMPHRAPRGLLEDSRARSGPPPVYHPHRSAPMRLLTDSMGGDAEQGMRFLHTGQGSFSHPHPHASMHPSQAVRHTSIPLKPGMLYQPRGSLAHSQHHQLQLQQQQQQQQHHHQQQHHLHQQQQHHMGLSIGAHSGMALSGLELGLGGGSPMDNVRAGNPPMLYQPRHSRVSPGGASSSSAQIRELRLASLEAQAADEDEWHRRLRADSRLDALEERERAAAADANVANHSLWSSTYWTRSPDGSGLGGGRGALGDPNGLPPMNSLSHAQVQLMPPRMPIMASHSHSHQHMHPQLAGSGQLSQQQVAIGAGLALAGPVRLRSLPPGNASPPPGFNQPHHGPRVEDDDDDDDSAEGESATRQVLSQLSL